MFFFNLNYFLVKNFSWILDNFDIFDFNSTSSNVKNESTLETLNQVSFIIKNMNYVINFFLYSALSSLFREELLAMFKTFNCKSFIKNSKKSSISEIVFPVALN